MNMKRYPAVTLILMMMLTAVLLVSGCNPSTPPAENEKVIYTSIYWDYWVLDPALFTHKQPNALVNGIYEGLIEFDENMELKPLLAESYDILDDGLTYTFKLRPGVKFHKDYGEMKASDVLFTFQRIKDMGADSTAGDLLKADNYEVSVNGDYEVSFTLEEPNPSFLTNLALWCGFIVSEKAVTELGDGFERNPVGTGPFEFEKAEWQQTTEMKRFADYWGEPASVERVVAYYITDPSSMYSAFDSGELNMINSENEQKNLDFSKQDDVNIITGPSNQVIGFGLNTSIKPLDDIRVRQAIFLAIDIDDFHANYLNGLQEKTTCMIPTSCLYALDGCFIPEYNIEKAKQLLAEAGYKDGFELEIVTYNDNRAEATVILQSYLAKIGITAKVTPLEMAAFGELAENQKIPMWYCGWSASVLPDDFLVRGWKSDGIFNYSAFNHPEYDELITKAVNELDEGKRTEYYYDAQRYLADQYVYYPIYTLGRTIVTTPNISGDPFTSLRYPFNFQGLTMD